MKKMMFFMILLATLSSISLFGNDYYVQVMQEGNNPIYETGTGSESNPFNFIQSAINAARAQTSGPNTIKIQRGDVLYIHQNIEIANFTTALTIERREDYLPPIYLFGFDNFASTVSIVLNQSPITLKSLTITRTINLLAPLYGGAIKAENNSSLIIEDCIIQNSKAYRGGGIYANQTPMYITNSKFFGNSGLGSSLDIYYGGAICSTGSNVTIENTLFYRNTHTSNQDTWGSIYMSGGSLNFISSTLVHYNSNYDTSIQGDSFSLNCHNSIVTYPYAGSLQYPSTYEYCCLVNTTDNSLLGAGSFITDPLFVNPTQNDYRLKWTETEKSPCIMAGYSEFGSFHYDRPDMGAIQYSVNPHEYFTYTFPPYNNRNGIKWMSFPTVDRISNFPYDQEMLTQLLDPVMQNQDIVSVIRKPFDSNPQDYYYNNGWHGIDHIVFPRQGYKITSSTNLQTEVSLSVPGTTTPDNTNIQIQAILDGHPNENWLGYFQDKTATVMDAFQGVIDNLYYIQTQNWTICRTKPLPNYPWIMPLINGQEPTLSYGDMVVIKCFGDATFQWNNSAPESVKIEKPMPEYYFYEEKTEFIPIYIDFTGLTKPKEVAVYINNVCKGAAVVKDNLVEVPAYIQEDLEGGAEIEIRMYFDGRSGDIIPKYKTWNEQLDMFENRSLFIKDRKDYFRISIGGDYTVEIPQISLSLTNNPNPFSSETSIKYYVPNETEISLDIYNTKGQKVLSVFSGKRNKGFYNFNWNGDDDRGKTLCNGVYFAVLKHQGKQVSRKIVLMK